MNPTPSEVQNVHGLSAISASNYQKIVVMFVFLWCALLSQLFAWASLSPVCPSRFVFFAESSVLILHAYCVRSIYGASRRLWEFGRFLVLPLETFWWRSFTPLWFLVLAVVDIFGLKLESKRMQFPAELMRKKMTCC